jgi:hypothetical protein
MSVLSLMISRRAEKASNLSPVKLPKMTYSPRD